MPGTVIHGAHAPKLERRISLDDWIYDGEISRIARERDNIKDTALKPPCRCRECIGSDGQRHSMPVQHDCEYVAARSALVPEASYMATAKIGDSILNGDAWTKEFCRQMELLWERHSHNGSAARNGAQNVELNGGQVSRSRNRIDATSAVVPMW